jgi:hypothetical protein
MEAGAGPQKHSLIRPQICPKDGWRDDMGWTNGGDQEMHAKLGDLYPNGHGANLHHFFMHLKDRRIAGHDTMRERVFFSLDQLTGC